MNNPDDFNHWWQEMLEELNRKEIEKLEEQAGIFIKMGFSTDELTVVKHPNGESEVSPICAFKHDD